MSTLTPAYGITEEDGPAQWLEEHGYTELARGVFAGESTRYPAVYSNEQALPYAFLVEPSALLNPEKEVGG